MSKVIKGLATIAAKPIKTKRPRLTFTNTVLEHLEKLENNYDKLARRVAKIEYAFFTYSMTDMMDVLDKINDLSSNRFDKELEKVMGERLSAKRRDIDGSPEKTGGTGTSRRSVKNPAKVFKN